MGIKKFPKETLKAVLWEDAEGFEVISNDLYDTSRWSHHYELIFKTEGKFYAVSYSRGATEMQEEAPFEYSPELVDCHEVEPFEVTTIGYRPVRDE